MKLINQKELIKFIEKPKNKKYTIPEIVKEQLIIKNTLKPSTRHDVYRLIKQGKINVTEKNGKFIDREFLVSGAQIRKYNKELFADLIQK